MRAFIVFHIFLRAIYFFSLSQLSAASVAARTCWYTKSWSLRRSSRSERSKNNKFCIAPALLLLCSLQIQFSLWWKSKKKVFSWSWALKASVRSLVEKKKKSDFLTSFSNNSTEHTVVARIFRFALLNWDLKVHETEQRARVNVEKKWEILHEKIKKRRLQWIVRDEFNLSAVSEKWRHVLTICEMWFWW